MKASQKKIVSALLICALLVAGAVAAGRAKGVVSEGESATEQMESEIMTAAAPEKAAENTAYQKADTDLRFWFEDETYADFFETAAVRYFEETGKKVTVECRDTIDYMGDIYDKTMQDDGFPDVYLISGDYLEEAYLYGLVSVRESDMEMAGAASNAVTASTYEEKLLGYPLSYNTCVFAYQTDYFETEPQSLQEIIDFSKENDPAENVEYLLEWDVNDAFYDFSFISNSVSFEKAEAETMKVVYDEELYQQDLMYFEEILTYFSVDATKVSEDQIVENFLEGRTLCAIIDTNSLYRLDGCSYSLMEIPKLNEVLGATTCAITDMLVVNDYSGKSELAADFAEFVTVTMASDLHSMTGHYSVIPSAEMDWKEQVAYASYESAILVPNSQDAKDFWVKLEETISQYF